MKKFWNWVGLFGFSFCASADFSFYKYDWYLGKWNLFFMGVYITLVIEELYWVYNTYVKKVSDEKVS